MTSRTCSLILLGAALLAGCGTNGHSNEGPEEKKHAYRIDTVPAQVIAGNFSDQRSMKLDSLQIIEFLKKHNLFKPFERDFFRFYTGREYALAWHDKNGMIEQAHILYNRILHMEDNGLDPEIPYEEEYTKLMETNNNENIGIRELMLTGEYLHFARKVLTGLPEQDLRSLDWFIPRKKTDYAALLEKLLSGERNAVSKSVYPQYLKLRNQLKKYREIEKKGGWLPIHLPTSRSIRPGDSSQFVSLLRNRLTAEGYETGKGQPMVYDSDLETAIRRFQKNHGIIPDGIIGKDLIRELNISLRDRIEQIMVNMERCRWLPNETSHPFMVVNIPEFKAYIYEQDSVVYSSKVVVGKETNKTVIFKGNMKFVVFSPYWNVPESILNKEILPAWRKNPNYLTINNMEWIDGKIRQKPGEGNALGLVKFIFPNAYNIYLHDTPTKQLFEREKRTFSHGCIRLSSPRELAIYLLQDQPEWTAVAIDEAMHAGIEKTVPIKNPIPVYIVYFTSFVDPQGELHFRKDVYDRDQALKDMMIKK